MNGSERADLVNALYRKVIENPMGIGFTVARVIAADYKEEEEGLLVDVARRVHNELPYDVPVTSESNSETLKY